MTIWASRLHTIPTGQAAAATSVSATLPDFQRIDIICIVPAGTSISIPPIFFLTGTGRVDSFIAEHMPISTLVMRELVDKISHSHVDGKTWVEKIINATSGCDEQAFSEFETYGNYCVKYHSDLFETRPLITMRTAGMLFGRGVNRNQLALLSRMGYDTASFEIRDMPSFPRNQFNWWERLVLRMYRDLGLVKK